MQSQLHHRVLYLRTYIICICEMKLMWSWNDRNRCFCHHLIWNIIFHAGEQKALSCRGYRYKGSYILESIKYKKSPKLFPKHILFCSFNAVHSYIGLGYKPHCLMLVPRLVVPLLFLRFKEPDWKPELLTTLGLINTALLQMVIIAISRVFQNQDRLIHSHKT